MARRIYLCSVCNHGVCFSYIFLLTSNQLILAVDRDAAGAFCRGDTLMEKRMKKFAMIAMLSALVATPALADSTGKFYIAGDLGKANYSNVDMGSGMIFPNPGALNIAAGYHFSPMLAVEVGYMIFGNSVLDFGSLGLGAGDLTLSMRSLHGEVVGTYPLNSQFDLIGKIGFSSNKGDVKGTGIVSGVTAGGSRTDVSLGAGVQYNISSEYAVRAQYQNFGTFGPATDDPKASAISLGFVANF